MRFKLVTSILATALLTSCANHGTIVEKRARPNPFAYSAGIDGTFSFLLRDQQGNVHSQMVTPEVYEHYQLGDYFDDQQPASATSRSGFNKDNAAADDSKAVKPVVHRRHTSAGKRKHHVAHRSIKRHLRATTVKHRDDEAPKPVTPDVSVVTPTPAGLSVTP